MTHKEKYQHGLNSLKVFAKFYDDRRAAVSATARKLAVIIWNIIAKKIPYQPSKDYLFLDQKRKLKLVQRIRKNIVKFDLKPNEVGFITI